MLKHNVQVEQAKEDFTIKNTYSYWDEQPTNRRFSEGDFIIKTDQPAHLFINTLFRRQMEIRDSVMYDMSSWSVPLAYNLDAGWTTSEVRVQTDRVYEALAQPKGVDNERAKYAYVINWQQRHAPKALARLWDHGYKVRSAEKGFSKNGQQFSKGSLVVLLGRNKHKEETIHADMEAIAHAAQVKIAGFNTGRMDIRSDLGSPSMRPIEEPNVALLMDTPFNSYTAGQLWFLFDQFTEFGISRIRANDLGSIELDEYDVIIMPGMWGNGGLDEIKSELFKHWVHQGGTLVGTENAGAWLTKERSGISNAALFSPKDDASEEVKDVAYARYEDREEISGLQRIPGAAFKGIIDNSHPLAFGMQDRLYSLKFGTNGI